MTLFLSESPASSPPTEKRRSYAWEITAYGTVVAMYVLLAGKHSDEIKTLKADHNAELQRAGIAAQYKVLCREGEALQVAQELATEPTEEARQRLRALLIGHDADVGDYNREISSWGLDRDQWEENTVVHGLPSLPTLQEPR